MHIPGTENLADLFTKILDPGDFIRQRGMIMIECPHVTQPYANMAREDPSDTPKDDPISSMPLVNAALKSGYAANVLCDEDDNSIRVTPVMIPAPIVIRKIVPVPHVVPSPKPVRVPFKKRVRINNARDD